MIGRIKKRTKKRTAWTCNKYLGTRSMASFTRELKRYKPREPRPKGRKAEVDQAVRHWALRRVPFPHKHLRSKSFMDLITRGRVR